MASMLSLYMENSRYFCITSSFISIFITIYFELTKCTFSGIIKPIIRICGLVLFSGKTAYI